MHSFTLNPGKRGRQSYHPNTIVPETDKAEFVSHSYTQGHRVAPRLHSSIKMAVIRILTEQLRYSIRGLRNSPGFTISALVILALGIGANTAIFSVVNAVLLKPLPFHESESIVMIFHVATARSFPGVSIFPASAANYLDRRSETNAFESMAAIGGRNLRLGGGSRPQSVSAAMTEPDFFHVLRVQPAIGRVFTAEEYQPGRDAVIVLSYGFAENHFGSASAAVGQSLDLDGHTRKLSE